MATVHRDAPLALFWACMLLGVHPIVQISAVSADAAAGTDYATTKQSADDFLQNLDLDWTVLRPSLVYGQGSYGGTSFLRGLAGLPLVIPVIGDGRQAFTPIHVEDLAAAILMAVEGRLRRVTLAPCGPETLTFAEIVQRTRAWLDLPPARLLHVPLPLVKLIARLGDVLRLGPVNSTALRQLEFGNAAEPATFAHMVEFAPRSMAEAFASTPSHVQDRWHARLYFLKPATTAALALTWFASGAIGLLAPAATAAAATNGLGFPSTAAPALSIGACLLDLAFALSVCAAPPWRTAALAITQAAVVIVYTLALTIAQPALWADPYGPLLKNLAVLALIGLWAALRDER